MKNLIAAVAMAPLACIAGGFKVTERAPAVCLVTVSHASNGDLTVSRTDVTDPSSKRRAVEFSDSAVAYYVCTNASWYGIESRIARSFVKVGGSFVDPAASAASGSTDAVRITSITLRGGVPEVTIDVDPSAGSVVEIEAKDRLTDPEWGSPKASSRFFRAIQKGN